MTIPKFDPKEMDVTGEIPATPFSPVMKIYNYPVSPREAFIAMMKKTCLADIKP